MSETKPANEALCLAALRDYDRDRYLAAILTPVDRRAGVAALYAYNAELARVRDLVREPLPGEVRLQYWRDLLQGIAHGASDANPVAAELLQAMQTYHLPFGPLAAMADARIFDLYDDPMETVSMFEGYAGETAAALIQLASLVLDPAAAASSAETAGHAGVAQAVAGCLLLLPIHRSRGQIYLPLEILRAVGLDGPDLLKGSDRVRLSAAIEAFAGLGLDHLEKARRSGRPARSILPAYLPMTLAQKVLLSARGKGAAILDHDIRPPQWRRQLRMMATLVSGRI
ncbi:phytoene/squalene synthase family protein [Rhizobium sp. SL42]|uniref:phytoene/squalene synthase family protein n=1 Tax=Rhizobium sp. SL42 TaxID=2806346 RepID=UPI001F3F2142|nr:phytoene/squalene synthase family protein [Rhizobium sp. SL42]UJW73514.1 phytoene/squalene synthase family protein [Rhizobium sp. SL42]